FIEHHQVVFPAKNGLLSLGKAFARQFDIDLRRLFPVDEYIPPRPHYRPARQVVGSQKFAVVAPLHEMDDIDAVTLPVGAERLPDGGGRLPLSVSGID